MWKNCSRISDKKGKESKYIFNYLDLITEHEKKKLGKAAVEGGKNKVEKRDQIH